LVQNILNHEQIIDDDSKTPAFVPWEGFQPLRLSHDPYLEYYNFLMLFDRNPRPSFTCSCQKILQIKIKNVNRKFAYCITNIVF
jgi:hypothetical protein